VGTKWFNTQEPELEELLSDPILHAVLARDHITVKDVQEVIASYKKVNSKRKMSLATTE